MPNKSKIKIGGVETFSSVDFPSHMSAVVFMQGCPWRCPFCYNTALQPINIDTNFVWDKFVDFLKSRRGILDAVIFSGGEPLVQDALLDAIDEVKELGFIIGLHTGGYRPDFFAEVLTKVDWVGFDIKSPFTEEHYKKAIGFTTTSHRSQVTDHVLTSLDLLITSGKSFECRTTCDPSILTIEDIYTIADFLHAKGVQNYHLQRYKPIKGDTIDEYECEKFMINKELTTYLRSKFKSVELRS